MSRVFHSSSSTGDWPGAVAAASGVFSAFPVGASVFRRGVSFPVHDLNEGPHVQR